jgi:hypothetical protein
MAVTPEEGNTRRLASPERSPVLGEWVGSTIVPLALDRM